MSSADRKFGVELEFSFQNRGTQAVNALLRKHGFDAWTEHTHEDGSEIEVDSPILRGQKGFQELKAVMDLLRANGAECWSYDGGHVHHDAPELIDDPKAAIRLLDSWIVNRHIIERFVSPDRHRNGACPRWGEGTVAEFKRHTPHSDTSIKSDWLFRSLISRTGDEEYALKRARCWGGGRYDLNLSSLRSHGTVEFRLHEGTVDFETLYPWIKFGQRLIHNALTRKRPIPPVDDPEVLLRRVRVSDKAKVALLARAQEVASTNSPFS